MPPPPRLLVVVPTLPTPSETFIAQHLDQVRSLGFATALIVGKNRSPIPPALAARADQVIFVPECPRTIGGRLSFVRRHLGAAGRDLSRLLRTLAFARLGPRGRSLEFFRWALALREAGPADLVHCHYLFTAEVLGGLRRCGFLTTPVVGTAHGYDLNVWARNQRPWVFPGSLAWVNTLTFGSDFMLGRFRASGIVGPALHMLPLGIDPARFPSGPRLPVERHSFTVLSVGRLERVKGLDVGLRGFAHLARSFPSARYWIAGDGPEKHNLIRLSRELGIEPNTHFLGPVDHEAIPKLYAQADAFLFPSITADDGAQEGQGLALLEAQAAALPVVASSSGGIPENMQPGKSGFLIREGSDEEIAAALLKLAQDPALRRAMGDAGRTFVEHNRTSTAAEDRLAKLYRTHLSSPV